MPEAAWARSVARLPEEMKSSESPAAKPRTGHEHGQPHAALTHDYGSAPFRPSRCPCCPRSHPRSCLYCPAKSADRRDRTAPSPRTSRACLAPPVTTAAYPGSRMWPAASTLATVASLVDQSKSANEMQRRAHPRDTPYPARAVRETRIRHNRLLQDRAVSEAERRDGRHPVGPSPPSRPPATKVSLDAHPNCAPANSRRTVSPRAVGDPACTHCSPRVPRGCARGGLWPLLTAVTRPVESTATRVRLTPERSVRISESQQRVGGGRDRHGMHRLLHRYGRASGGGSRGRRDRGHAVAGRRHDARRVHRDGGIPARPCDDRPGH